MIVSCCVVLGFKVPVRLCLAQEGHGVVPGADSDGGFAQDLL